jgi:hypothetical protein
MHWDASAKAIGLQFISAIGLKSGTHWKASAKAIGLKFISAIELNSAVH